MSLSRDDDAKSELDQIVTRLEVLVAQPHVSSEYVRFRIALLKAQWAVREALAVAAPPISHSKSAGTSGPVPIGKETTSAGPALDPDTVAFDPELLQRLFVAICESAAQSCHQTEDMQRLTVAVTADPALLEGIARRSAFGPDLAYIESVSRQVQVFVDALLFVGRALAAPFVAEAVRRVAAGASSVAGVGEAHARCPMCGSPPTIAKLRREDGRRILFCGLCGRSWEFDRLACPCCENRDHGSLGLLRISEADPRWLETCEVCNGYIKTVDERRLAEGETIVPLVEETATLYLDLLAEKEGYIRRLPYALS